MTNVENTPDPVGTVEIAERLEVTRTAVDKWRQRDTGFPQPDYTVGARPAWEWSKVKAWAKKTGRLAFVAAFVGIALAGCGGAAKAAAPTTTKAPATIKTWSTVHQSVVDGLTRTSKAINGLTGDMTQNCKDLGGWAAKAVAAGPIPDPDVQAHWKVAVADYGSGSKLCVAGFKESDDAKLTSFAKRMGTADPELEVVSTAITNAP